MPSVSDNARAMQAPRTANPPGHSQKGWKRVRQGGQARRSAAAQAGNADQQGNSAMADR